MLSQCEGLPHLGLLACRAETWLGVRRVGGVVGPSSLGHSIQLEKVEHALEKGLCYHLCVPMTILELSFLGYYKSHLTLSFTAFPSTNCLWSHGKL